MSKPNSFIYSLSQKLTNCAIRKATIRKRPGRSRKDQLLDLVTKMRAWLTILT